MSRFAGTGTLVRLILRRDRVRLPIWLVALTGLIGASAAAVQDLYDTPAARASYASTVESSAASVLLSGPPVGLRTLGGITVFEVNQVAVIGIALMAIFLTLRHTRTDEEAGRTELLRAGVLGRNADLAAVGVVLLGATMVVGAVVSGVFIAVGLPLQGALLFGKSVTGIGLVFTALALVAAQVAEHSRGAVGLSLAALGGLYLLRGLGDVTDSWLVWLSPIGWAQSVHAFGDERWWPLLPTYVFVVAMAALAGWLTTRRDIGAGLLRPRPGAPVAAAWLRSPLALAVRLQRGTLIGWSAGLAALGAVFGSLGEDVVAMVEDNPDLAEMFAQQGGDVPVTDAFFATVFVIMALVASGFTVSSVLRVRGEEGAARTELVLATPVSRLRWAGSWWAVSLVGTVIVLGAGGLAAGLVHGAMSADGSQVGRLLVSALAYVPAALALGGLAGLLYGWLPRATAFAWGALALCFLAGWLGQVLSLPDWFLELSPYTHVPQLPHLDGLGALVLVVVISALLGAGGLAGFRRRDLATE